MIYKFADCELDTDLLELRRKGVPVAVQPQVFDLIRVFAENPERAISKDEILDQVWGGRIVSETALSSRIKAARQAIGDNGSDQMMIKTIHGRGFRFAVEVEMRSGQRSPQSFRAAPMKSANPNSRPSIAVLPFQNASSVDDWNYFAEGLSDEISSLLSRLRWIKVISHDSSQVVSGLARANPAETLGVDYLLRGNVRQEGESLRVSVRLLSTAEGEQIWSEFFDRKLAGVFEMQDEIALAVAGALGVELEEFESELAARKTPGDLTAWDYCLRGRARLFSFTNVGLAEAEDLFRKALEIDSEMSQVYSGLAYVNVQNAFYAGKELRPRHLAQALAMGQKAVEIDARDPTARFALGRAQSLNGEPDRALEELAIAIRLNPSFAQAQLAVGFTHTCNQSPKMALPHFERFSELSPWDPHTWTNHHMCGMAHYWLGELEEGEKRCRRAIAEANATYWPFATLVSLLGTAGDFRAGKKALDTLLSCRPGYSVSVASDDFFFLNDPENLGRYLDGLRAAGVPE